MNEAGIAAFFARFVAHARATVSRIIEAQAQGDSDTLARQAHALIGSAAMLGLTEIAGIARQLELGAKDATATELAQDLSTAVGELEAALAEAD